MSDQDAELLANKRINNRWMAEAESWAKLQAMIEAKGIWCGKGSPMPPGSVVIAIPFSSGSSTSQQQEATAQ